MTRNVLQMTHAPTKANLAPFGKKGYRDTGMSQHDAIKVGLGQSLEQIIGMEGRELKVESCLFRSRRRSIRKILS